MPNETTAQQWPSWAAHLIRQHGWYGATTCSIKVPADVFEYICERMQREKLDAMLDAEIGYG